MYHCEVGCTTKCDLELKEIFVGSCTLGASAMGGSDLGADVRCEGVIFCFLLDLRGFSGI